MPEVSAKPGIKLFIYFTFTIVSKEIEPWYLFISHIQPHGKTYYPNLHKLPPLPIICEHLL